MPRKVFISVLGTGNYSECVYVVPNNGYKSAPVRYIQEATLDYLSKKEQWTGNDVAYILLTDGVKKLNWDDNGHTDRNGNVICQTGLKTQLDKANFPMALKIIDNLPIGKNEKEIWEIFNRTFEQIDEDDELYFDLTHGFRYLPMLILVLGNYSKFLKRVKVKSITYGSFEGRDKETNEAPIIDLLPLSSLQDWTYAAGQYLESGNVDKLVKLCENEYKPILKETKGCDTGAANLRYFTNALHDVIEERQTCRGISIINSENFKKLKQTSEKISSTTIEPLNPIFTKIKASFSTFDENENIMNGYAAAVWCFQNKLYQQAATILQEFVISFLCQQYNIAIDNEDKRDLVTSAFAIKFNKITEDKWRNSEEDKEIIRKILCDNLLNNEEMVNSFNNLSEVRNDFNHSGMRSKRSPMKPKSIKSNIESCINAFEEIVSKTNESC